MGEESYLIDTESQEQPGGNQLFFRGMGVGKSPSLRLLGSDPLLMDCSLDSDWAAEGGASAERHQVGAQDRAAQDRHSS